MINFSIEEEMIREKIREVYNSGKCYQAVEMSKEFLLKYPESGLAKYSYAVMCGDYASDLCHSAEEKARLLAIAKDGTKELFNDPNLQYYPKKFQKSVKNEYYWFHEMPFAQYQLGLEEIPENPNGGHYSACVGASMVAYKLAREENIFDSEQWATKSLAHFKEFEKISPEWYNINYFSAQAAACLGEFEAARDLFKGMYRKQKTEDNLKEIEEFEARIQEINKWRS